MAYKKLQKEIEALVNLRLENILSQINLPDEDKENILVINKKLSNISSKRKNSANISGYNLFAREMFPEVKQENEGMPTKDLLRIIASMWQNLDKQEKDNLNERAKSIKPKTKQEKKQNKIQNNKQIAKTKTLTKSNKNVIVVDNNKDSKHKFVPKTSDSKLSSAKSSVKSTPAQSDTEQSQGTIKNLLSKLKLQKSRTDE